MVHLKGLEPCQNVDHCWIFRSSDNKSCIKRCIKFAVSNVIRGIEINKKDRRVAYGLFLCA